MDIPFENIARKTFTKAKLLKVLTSYKLSNSETSSLPDCTETIRDRSPIHTYVNIPDIEETADLYPSLEDQDVVTISESSGQDNPEVSDLLNQTFELSNDSFLPGLSAHCNSRQPEITSQDVTFSTSSLATLAHAQPITPLNVIFKPIEDTVKQQFVTQLSNSNTLLSGLCVNSFMVSLRLLVALIINRNK